ncbi:MerR family transcriptional regulator [Brevibacillus borstelensis]|uniref:MerR family transcriptional regulator n=1 Tax=Brevibacillus borstelensis TaxID=45462 RepID=UPI003CE5AB6A
MLYTVKEIAALSNVTVKTLHHYHSIGLLLPCEISEAGYRLYGTKELERLQHILFYKELDFPLEKIMQLLEGAPDRLSILASQKELLLARKQRLERVIQTLDESISHAENGEQMNQAEMFKGFCDEEEWMEALAEQKRYLEETYDFSLPSIDSSEVPAMNQMAREAKRFTDGMADFLAKGVKFDDESIHRLISEHIAFLNQSGHATSADDFAARTRFFLDDDFHRKMLEEQQTGLAYYLSTAAESFAAKEKSGTEAKKYD